MRTVWKGNITFGMVVVPVRLGSVVPGPHSILHWVRVSDGSRIRLMKIAEADIASGEEIREVPWSEIGYGFDIPGGTVVLSQDELAEVNGTDGHKAEIVTFVRADAVPALAADKSYHVRPGDGGDKAYALLRDALLRSGRVGILRFSMREKVHMAALAASEEGYLTLSQLHYGDEVTTPDFAAPEFEFSEGDKAMADQLIEVYSDDEWAFSGTRDDRAARLEALMQRKSEQGPTHPSEGTAAVSSAGIQGLALMESIQASLEKARADRAEKEKPARASRQRGKRTGAGGSGSA